MIGKNNSFPNEQYIIQGNDFKASNWMAQFGENAQFFISAQDLLRMLRQRGNKHVIFRYQNSSARMTSDLAYTLVILLLTSVRKFINTEIYWIMHNIDRETVDKFPILTRLRRACLTRASKCIFVTDPMFKEQFFSTNDKVKSITFGPKSGGSISGKSLDVIVRLSKQYDLVALCVGASGDKYVHYQRLEHLCALSQKHDKTLLLILPEHTDYHGENVIHVSEKNIDEEKVAPYVDFIYRINDDISMPYTIYAACGARIPVVTGSDYFTFEIVKKYGIGFSEEEFFDATDVQIARVKTNMEKFMKSRSWNSLAEVLISKHAT